MRIRASILSYKMVKLSITFTDKLIILFQRIDEAPLKWFYVVVSIKISDLEKIEWEKIEWSCIRGNSVVEYWEFELISDVLMI